MQPTNPALTYIDHAFLQADLQIAPADIRFATHAPLGMPQPGTTVADRHSLLAQAPESVYHDVERFYPDFSDRYHATEDQSRRYDFKFDATATPDGSIRRGHVKIYGAQPATGGAVAFASDVRLWNNQFGLDFSTVAGRMLFSGFHVVVPQPELCAAFGLEDSEENVAVALHALFNDTLSGAQGLAFVEEDPMFTTVRRGNEELSAQYLPTSVDVPVYYIWSEYSAADGVVPMIGPRAAVLFAKMRGRQSELPLYEFIQNMNL